MRDGSVLFSDGSGDGVQFVRCRSVRFRDWRNAVHVVCCGPVRVCDGRSGLHELRGGAVLGNDRRVTVDGLHGLCFRHILVSHGAGSCVVSKLPSRAVRVGHRPDDVHAVCFGSVRLVDGDGILHDLPSGHQPAHDRRIGVDELRQLRCGALLVGVEPGRCVQLVRRRCIRVVPGQYCLPFVRSRAVCLPNGVDTVHVVPRGNNPRGHRGLGFNELCQLSFRTVLVGNGLGIGVHQLQCRNLRSPDRPNSVCELPCGPVHVINRRRSVHELRSRSVVCSGKH
jgi:hypothetical protein